MTRWCSYQIEFIPTITKLNLMNSDNPKIQSLLTLGQPENKRDWPDYQSQCDFNEKDIPALIDLYIDEEINAMDSDRPEVWAPVHAWRILGQLGSIAAIDPIITSFDTLFEDDYAQSELPKVIGMIGPAAIPALSHYWQQPGKDAFSYGMAVDALCEIAKQHPEHREQVLAIYEDYMAEPDLSSRSLNGILIGQLLDLKAVESIDSIRRLFGLGCVDISFAGDLEEVEIELGFRSKRSTPKPSFADMYGVENPFESFTSSLEEDEGEDEIFKIIDFYLGQYGSDESILDSSELDGFFAAIICAPKTIMPSNWMPLIWGGEQYAPEWENIDEFTRFNQAIMEHYNGVASDLQASYYEPLYLESKNSDADSLIVDEWCEGFFRGLNLWGEIPPVDMKQLENGIYPMRHFATGEGLETLTSMSQVEIQQLQESIQPNVEKLYRYFFKPVKTASTTFVHAGPKVGRNEPCPCGSGKKYKKCCGLN